jgi:hypothetical protein
MGSGRSSAALLLGVGAAVVALGGFAAVEAVTFLPSLNIEQPPLAAIEVSRSDRACPESARGCPDGEAGGPRASHEIEVPSSPPTRRLTERVVLVIVDGLRLDASRTMPALDRLRAIGVDAEASSHYPSMSRPNYVSIVAGVPPQWSGVRSNDYDQAVPLDSAPKRARAAGLGVTFLSQTAAGPRVMFGPHVDHAPIIPDEELLEAAVVAALASDHELIAVLIGAVDHAGHAHGGASVEYAQAVARVDAMLDRLTRAIDLERHTVIVVADHGHIDEGGHGGLEPEVMDVPLVLAGAGIRPGAPLVRAQIADVAPTVCALLGIELPRHSLGITLVDALTLDITEQDALRRADKRRIRALTQAMAEIRLEAEDLAWATRLGRGGIALFVLAGLVIAIMAASRRGLILIDLRVLAVAIPAFPLTFYVMALTLEHMLTPSMVPAAGTLATQLFRYGLVAAGVHVAIGWLMVAHRSRPEVRVAAAAGLALAGMVVMLVPSAIAWVIAGPPFTARLPGPDVLMLPPTTYAAVACYCMGSVVFVALEYVAFIRRGRRAPAAD